ncbi:uncharacterized protein LOC111691870 [Anoplophora glabripennis]|uniref:uncharacterized protein LOC111691645 n=1 Tax=Anoplophora glabripennis TaxID=217634 RepID=UPI000C778FA5|nr:uncharacterized protein LOC111691645 [Anoplophora glabripennis]XP_023311058.1 uncharacterized protein LOC111691870 [Anoplophora glabripennis]
MAASEKELQKNIDMWKEVLGENGMKINVKKTKTMAITEEQQKINIQIDGVRLEQVQYFDYLGVLIEGSGKQDKEIEKRIENTMKVYHSINKSFINKREISTKTKMNVYQAVYKPILTYGCETWILTRQHKSKIQATEMKYLRRVRGVTKMDRMRSEQIRKDLGVQSVLEFIEQRQLSWWGHLQRMNNSRQVKRIWEAKIQAKRRRGRPRETWDSTAEKALENRGKSWQEAKLIARDKKQWRKFVYK